MRANMVSTPSVSVIVLNYNGANETNECLRSIEQQNFEDYEVVLVDNGSEPESFDALQPRTRTRIYRLKENVGFARGCNFGARKATGDYLFFLNHDATVQPDTIPTLLSVITASPDTAAVVPRVYFEHEKQLIDKGLGVFDNLGFGWHPFHLARADEEHVDEAERETVWGSGCAFLVDATVFEELGRFDPDFFMYTEDLDFCLRLRKVGYAVQLAPSATVYHKYSRGVKDELELDRTPFQVFHEQRNRAKLLTKHYPLGPLLRYSPHIFLSFLYWNVHIARRTSLREGVEALSSQIQYAAKGAKERVPFHVAQWKNLVKTHGIRDFITIGLNRKSLYEGEIEVTETGIEMRT